MNQNAAQYNDFIIFSYIFNNDLERANVVTTIQGGSRARLLTIGAP